MHRWMLVTARLDRQQLWQEGCWDTSEGNKLSVSQHCTLPAKKANSVLSSSRKSVASRLREAMLIFSAGEVTSGVVSSSGIPSPKSEMDLLESPVQGHKDDWDTGASSCEERLEKAWDCSVWRWEVLGVSCQFVWISDRRKWRCVKMGSVVPSGRTGGKKKTNTWNSVSRKQ